MQAQMDVEQLEGAFRQDARNRFGDEYSYDQLEPAYRFGREFAECEECQDKSWADVSDDARTRFEERNPGGWDRFGPAVEHAYKQTRTAGR